MVSGGCQRRTWRPSPFRASVPSCLRASHESRQRGFTLVELLVVIGIIAILMGILLPVLAAARAKAKDTQCESNIRQLGMGMMMYTDQNKGYMPFDSNSGSYSNPLDYDSNNNQCLGMNGTAMWFNAVLPMINLPDYYTTLNTNPNTPGEPVPTLGDNSVLICPSATAMATASTTPKDGETANVRCVNNSYFEVYAETQYIGPLTPAGTAPPKANAPTNAFYICLCYAINSKIHTGTHPTVKLSQLAPSSSIALFVERRMSPNEITPSDPQYTSLTTKGLLPSAGGSDYISGYAMAPVSACWETFTSRHRNGGYICFADGHCDWYSLDQVCYPPNYNASTSDYNDPANVIWDPWGVAHN